jgi:hypothetical protein
MKVNDAREQAAVIVRQYMTQQNRLDVVNAKDQCALALVFAPEGRDTLAPFIVAACLKWFREHGA